MPAYAEVTHVGNTLENRDKITICRTSFDSSGFINSIPNLQLDSLSLDFIPIYEPLPPIDIIHPSQLPLVHVEGSKNLNRKKKKKKKSVNRKKKSVNRKKNYINKRKKSQKKKK